MMIFLGLVAIMMIVSTVLGLAAMMLSSTISREEEWGEGWLSPPIRHESAGD